MELRQRVSANGILMEQTAREYSIKDYDDVGPEFICQWLFRHFQGQNVVSATRKMLYQYLLDRMGPVREYRTNMIAAKALGIKPSAFKVQKSRLLAETNKEESE